MIIRKQIKQSAIDPTAQVPVYCLAVLAFVIGAFARLLQRGQVLKDIGTGNAGCLKKVRAKVANIDAYLVLRSGLRWRSALEEVSV